MLEVTLELTPLDAETIDVSHAGFIALRGEQGAADSRSVDQPSMVLVDMVQFIAGVRLIFTGDARGFRMMAQGSAFELAFQRTSQTGLAIAAQGELIEHGEVAQMADAILAAARTLWTDARPRLRQDDSAIIDIEAEFEVFEAFVAGLGGTPG